MNFTRIYKAIASKINFDYFYLTELQAIFCGDLYIKKQKKLQLAVSKRLLGDRHPVEAKDEKFARFSNDILSECGW